jgi:cytochrome c55X
MSSSPLLLALAALPGLLAVPAAAEPTAERQKELVHLVRQDCGSCHGMTLQGGLGPALLPATLADKPVEGLVATVLGGRNGTAMPPWHRFLAEEDAQWIVARLMSGFPQ